MHVQVYVLVGFTAARQTFVNAQWYCSGLRLCFCQWSLVLYWYNAVLFVNVPWSYAGITLYFRQCSLVLYWYNIVLSSMFIGLILV